MKYRTRRYFTETDKALIWDRWQKDDSLHAPPERLGQSRLTRADYPPLCPVRASSPLCSRFKRNFPNL